MVVSQFETEDIEQMRDALYRGGLQMGMTEVEARKVANDNIADRMRLIERERVNDIRNLRKV